MNEIFDTGIPLCEVTDAEYISNHKLRLKFSDNKIGEIDFTEIFQKPFLKPLTDQRLFKQYGLESGTLTWPGGIDIAPEYLYSIAIGRNWVIS